MDWTNVRLDKKFSERLTNDPADVIQRPCPQVARNTKPE